MKTDTDFMRLALEEAGIAASKGEIPVGAVVVREGQVLSRAHNLNRTLSDPSAHAEMLAIREACRVLGNERLTGCGLFVTKEPCAMCAGAIVHARIARVVIAARDEKYGACGTVLHVCGDPRLNHAPELVFGVEETEASALLRDFFKRLRAGKE
jgi:tRNA(adenine34) deaminase